MKEILNEVEAGAIGTLVGLALAGIVVGAAINWFLSNPLSAVLLTGGLALRK